MRSTAPSSSDIPWPPPLPLACWQSLRQLEKESFSYASEHFMYFSITKFKKKMWYRFSFFDSNYFQTIQTDVFYKKNGSKMIKSKLFMFLGLLVSCRHRKSWDRGVQDPSPPPTMGCHPMLTENTNFVTNALKSDLSTVNVRPWCGHLTWSVHQWIGNWSLPQFDTRRSSLALLEAEISSPL